MPRPSQKMRSSPMSVRSSKNSPGSSVTMSTTSWETPTRRSLKTSSASSPRRGGWKSEHAGAARAAYRNPASATALATAAAPQRRRLERLPVPAATRFLSNVIDESSLGWCGRKVPPSQPTGFPPTAKGRRRRRTRLHRSLAGGRRGPGGDARGVRHDGLAMGAHRRSDGRLGGFPRRSVVAGGDDVARARHWLRKHGGDVWGGL